MQRFIKSFGYAFTGLTVFFRHEANGRIQMLASMIVVFLGWWLNVSAIEWVLLVGCIATVLALEMMNSAVEKLCNLVHPTVHPAIKIIKDMAAGAVLWAAIASVVTGCIIFIPKILNHVTHEMG